MLFLLSVYKLDFFLLIAGVLLLRQLSVPDTGFYLGRRGLVLINCLLL